MFDDLRKAIEAETWQRALVLALETWRERRIPAIADLVDRIARRCPTDPPPRPNLQAWWLQHALVYDPINATELCASASTRASKSDVTFDEIVARWPGNRVVQRLHAAVPGFVEANFVGQAHRNRIDRLAAFATWPDDPRVTRVITSWFEESEVAWQYPYNKAAEAFYEICADELLRLRDVRAVVVMERVLANPNGKTLDLRDRQRMLAERVIDQLAAHEAGADPVEAQLLERIASWCPAPVEETRVEEHTLWREAAHGDLGARLVLADYLLERNDRRGEIITLACSGVDANRRKSSELLHEHWEHWMGDLALVLDRGNSTFTDGLLDIASIGIHATPEWAYPKVVHHRELATMRTVRPGWNASQRGYVAFLDALETIPPRVGINAVMLQHMTSLRGNWPIRDLELMVDREGRLITADDVFDLAARIMPGVQTIRFPLWGGLDLEVVEAIELLPDLFPALERVHVDAAQWLPPEIRDALARLAQLPFVDVDHGSFD